VSASYLLTKGLKAGGSEGGSSSSSVDNAIVALLILAMVAYGDRDVPTSHRNRAC
jgi:hypothetical protein